MEIQFTGHAAQQYDTRFSQIDANANEDKLRREIIRAGVFYVCQEGGMYCVVNNLKVFGVVVAGNLLKIITSYAYDKGMRRKLVALQRVNIPNIGKPCKEGADLQKLLEEGANLQMHKTPA